MKLKSGFVRAGVAMLALASIATMAPAPAKAWWVHGGYYGGPVVVAPPPVVYARPPVVYAPPPVVYGAPVYPRPYARWIPGHRNAYGYWVPGHYV